MNNNEFQDVQELKSLMISESIKYLSYNVTRNKKRAKKQTIL
jgi:hypothetical protein